MMFSTHTRIAGKCCCEKNDNNNNIQNKRLIDVRV